VVIDAYKILLASCFLSLPMLQTAYAVEIEYPQVIKVRYEAQDPKAGGNFVIWSEREKIQYGLDPRLFPAARYVEVTQVTPSVGSITLTFIEVRTINGSTPDYLHLTGNVRFRVSGMVLRSSNFPEKGPMKP
jgi:hypothetical protein